VRQSCAHVISQIDNNSPPTECQVENIENITLSGKIPESNKEIVETEEQFDTTYTHNDIYLTAHFPGLIPASQEQYIFQILL